MRAVNLLPRDSRRERSITAQNLPAVVGGCVGLVVVAALAAGYLSASAKVGTAQRALDAANVRLSATPLPPPQATTPTQTTPDAVTTQQGPRLQSVSSVLSQRIAWDRVLREFSAVLPTDVWITSLTLGASGSGAGAGAFSIQASTYSYDGVARMLSRMALVPDLTGVQLGTLAKAHRLVTFAINASVKGAPVPAAATATVAPAVPATTTTTGSSS